MHRRRHQNLNFVNKSLFNKLKKMKNRLIMMLENQLMKKDVAVGQRKALVRKRKAPVQAARTDSAVLMLAAKAKRN